LPVLAEIDLGGFDQFLALLISTVIASAAAGVLIGTTAASPVLVLALLALAIAALAVLAILSTDEVLEPPDGYVVVVDAPGVNPGEISSKQVSFRGRGGRYDLSFEARALA
jgi:hypothetical protein